MNHIELGLQESKQATEPDAFSIWCDKVCDILNIADLDGDMVEDGYSLDSAYETYAKGATPEAYASVVSSIRYNISMNEAYGSI